MLRIGGAVGSGPPGRWAAAVRRPDGVIVTTARPAPRRPRWARLPVVRGVVALIDGVAVGVQATVWSARQRSEEVTSRGAAIAAAVGVAAAVVVFGWAPALAATTLDPGGVASHNAVETGVRLGLIVAYLAALGRSPRVRDVFAYHGAEHQVVNALEAGRVPDPETTRAASRDHPRCGTTFILLVAVLAGVVHLVVGTPGVTGLILSRVLLLPVVAGVAFEVLRWAADGRAPGPVRALLRPGLWLQRLTTRPPTDAHREVALAALAALRDPGGPPVGMHPTTASRGLAP